MAMDCTTPPHLLLRSLSYAARKQMIRTIFATAEVYSVEDLCDCVCTLEYPDAFWYIINADVEAYLKYPKLWTDPESECFDQLKAILMESWRTNVGMLHRYMQCVHPESQCIPDLTYANMFDILCKPKHEVASYLSSIMPKTKGYIEMKKKEYLGLMADKSTEAEGIKLAKILLRKQYHHVVADYMSWPTTKAVLVALLEQKLVWRNHVFGNHDCGWVPDDYISICSGPLMWETDEVRAYTEAGSSSGRYSHAGDVRV
jgi:hypothetical protein